MKLTKVSIQRYRSITGPTEFDIEPDVTTLVGKNESGKTAVLQSLHKSNPVDNAKFDSNLDFPTHKTRENSRHAEIKVTDLTYSLDEEDVAAIEDALFPDVLNGDSVIVTTGYRYSAARWSVPIDETKVVEHLRANLDLPSADETKVDNATSVAELVAALQNLESSTPTATATLEKITSWRDQNPTLAAIDALDMRRPKFVYFGDYDVMPGKVSIPRLIRSRDNRTLKRSEEALLALLSMADVKLEDLQSTESHEHLIRQMENASNTISDEVFEYWSQNKKLQVKLQEIATPEPDAEPPLDLAPLLQVRVENTRHRVTVPFDERSRGFVWFFSFMAYFSKLEEKSSQPLVLLLDEPGLSLHAKAQNDLLRFINDRLAPKHQVIFTTHSPFMVNPHSFHKVRTVVDNPQTGTKVSSDVLTIDKDSTFPLQAALGIELTQTLFIGPHVLLVEGPSDVIYLQYLSDRLADAGKTGLDGRWTIVPGGGITKLPAFLALFGANSIKVAVVADSSTDIREQVIDLERLQKVYNGGIIQIGDVLGAQEADIEDLLPEHLYVDLVNEAYRGLLSQNPLVLEDLPEGPRIVKRVEVALKERDSAIKRLNHFSPAGALLRKGGRLELSTAKLEAAEVLIRRINSLLGD